MLEPYHIIIPGEPKAQQRHRSAIRPRANTGRRIGPEKWYRLKDLFIHNYDASARDKLDIRMLCPKPKAILEGPLKVDLHLYYAYRKGDYGTGRNASTLKPSAPEWKATKPDRDNADKIILDALEGWWWKNDAQICDGRIVKKYSHRPRTEVFISRLERTVYDGK